MTTRLVVAPHADDETLGCGGLLAKYRDEVLVVVVAEPDEIRKREMLAAKEILNYGGASVLGYEDGRLGEDMARLVADLDDVYAETQPDEVYLPFPGMHQDHVAVYEAGMRAARLSMTEGHWYPPTVLVYDVAAYDVALYPSDLRWNVFEPLTADQVLAKKAACAAYDSQVPPGAHPINGIVEAAAVIGQARRVDYAEQYALVRSVR